MSLKDLYNSGNRNDPNTTVTCASLETDSLNVLGTLSCNDLNVLNDITAGNDITASNDLYGIDTVLSGKLVLSNKYVSPNTNISPAPSFNITYLCGVINLLRNVAFLNGTAIDVTLNNVDITTNSVILVSMGPPPTTTSALTSCVKSVTNGSAVVTILNATGADYVGADLGFSYLIV